LQSSTDNTFFEDIFKRCLVNPSIIFEYMATYSLVGFIDTAIVLPVKGSVVGVSFHFLAIKVKSITGDFAFAPVAVCVAVAAVAAVAAVRLLKIA